MRNLRKAWDQIRKPVKNEKGVALMVAVAALMLIMYFAMEVSYESNVEYIVNSQSLNRVKAYYAAKSGMQLSLLRIKIYQQAQSQLGDKLGDSPLLDQIWQFPFAWPLPVPDEMNAVDKDAFKKVVKESSMDSSYIVTIEDEGSKIDLNDLNSPSKFLRDATKQQLLNIFEQKKKDDEEFAREYSGFNFEELVNNIADWQSDKATSLNGGAKNAKYGDMNRDTQDYYPPNRAFRTLAELHLVPGMEDTFFDILEPRVTIYGMKGINPNLATKEVLKSLDPAMTDEVVTEIIKRRSSEEEGGPFKCEKDNPTSKDFWDFVASRGVRVIGDPNQIPMTCEKVMNFKIRSTGEFAGATREITAIVMDLDRTAATVKSYVDKEKQEPNPDPTATPSPSPSPSPTPTPGGGNTTNQKPALPKGAPRVVFWNER